MSHLWKKAALVAKVQPKTLITYFTNPVWRGHNYFLDLENAAFFSRTMSRRIIDLKNSGPNSKRLIFDCLLTAYMYAIVTRCLINLVLNRKYHIYLFDYICVFGNAGKQLLEIVLTLTLQCHSILQSAPSTSFMRSAFSSPPSTEQQFTMPTTVVKSIS